MNSDTFKFNLGDRAGCPRSENHNILDIRLGINAPHAKLKVCDKHHILLCEYAALYEAGRVRAIADIETEPIQQCHRQFLRSMKVRANLSVPILTKKGLWGLLIAHQCSGPRTWLRSDIEFMQKQAQNMAMSPTIQDS